MGFAAMKQHIEKLKHWGFSEHLSQSLTGHETDLKTEWKRHRHSQQPKRKAHKSVLHQFFIKKSSAATKERMCQGTPSAASSSTHEEGWTVKKQAIKAEIIATLQLSSQNMPFSAAESLAMCYQQQFPDSLIGKSAGIGPNKMSYVVAYGLRPYFTDMTIRELIEGPSYFTLHFDETVNAQVIKQMDVLVWFWSETHNEVRVKSLTSVMFGDARAEDVVKEILGVLDRLAINKGKHQTDAFSWNGWAQCEQIYNAQDKPGQERERLWTID